MPRANFLIAATLCSAAILLFSAPANAQSADYINGIGLIDYRQKPILEIGSWVKYHITSNSKGGAKDDYFVTILVAGEEHFWEKLLFGSVVERIAAESPKTVIMTKRYRPIKSKVTSLIDVFSVEDGAEDGSLVARNSRSRAMTVRIVLRSWCLAITA